MSRVRILDGNAAGYMREPLGETGKIGVDGAAQRGSSVISEAYAKKYLGYTPTAAPPSPVLGAGTGKVGLYLPLVSSLAPVTGLFNGDTGITPSAVGDAPVYNNAVNGQNAWEGNGTNRGIKLNGGIPLCVLTSDFTMEFWFRDAHPTGSMSGILAMRGGGGNGGHCVVAERAAGFNFYNGSANTFNIRTAGWHHFSFVRDAGTIRAYRDGVKLLERACGNLQPGTTVPVIGMSDASGGECLEGNLQQFLLINGWAGRTADFTPPNYV